MELRPSHKVPLWDLTKRFVELRSSHTTPPWDLTKRFMELHPTHTISMSHQPTIDLSCITNLYQIQPTTPSCFMNSFTPINSNPNISYRAYMASYLNCLKQKSSNHVKHTHKQSTLSISLRLKSSHSGERNLSLKLPALAWARLQIEGTSRSRSS